MERVISRADLIADDETSRSSSVDLPQLKHLQEFDFVHHEDSTNTANEQEAADEDGFAFQLFAPASGKATSTSHIARIRLDSPNPTDAEPGLVNPTRDSSYYFTSTPSAEEKQNFEAAAISGQDLLVQSRTAWPGMAYTWKVLHVPTTKRQQRLLEPSNAILAKLMNSGDVSRHKRPGKKARLAVRIKLATAKAKQEELQKAAEAKGAEEREKRMRRNREKKAKKKSREKAKKAGTADATTAAEEKMDLDDAESQDD